MGIAIQLLLVVTLVIATVVLEPSLMALEFASRFHSMQQYFPYKTTNKCLQSQDSEKESKSKKRREQLKCLLLKEREREWRHNISFAENAAFKEIDCFLPTRFEEKYSQQESG